MQIQLHALLVATAAIGCAADVTPSSIHDRPVLALADGIVHEVDLGRELVFSDGEIAVPGEVVLGELDQLGADQVRVSVALHDDGWHLALSPEKSFASLNRYCAQWVIVTTWVDTGYGSVPTYTAVCVVDAGY
jgi:hypothetical protein